MIFLDLSQHSSQPNEDLEVTKDTLMKLDAKATEGPGVEGMVDQDDDLKWVEDQDRNDLVPCVSRMSATIRSATSNQHQMVRKTMRLS